MPPRTRCRCSAVDMLKRQLYTTRNSSCTAAGHTHTRTHAHALTYTHTLTLTHTHNSYSLLVRLSQKVPKDGSLLALEGLQQLLAHVAAVAALHHPGGDSEKSTHSYIYSAQ